MLLRQQQLAAVGASGCPGSRFIAGDPIKPATNSEAGRWYLARGADLLRHALFITMTRCAKVIAST